MPAPRRIEIAISPLHDRRKVSPAGSAGRCVSDAARNAAISRSKMNTWAGAPAICWAYERISRSRGIRDTADPNPIHSARSMLANSVRGQLPAIRSRLCGFLAEARGASEPSCGGTGDDRAPTGQDRKRVRSGSGNSRKPKHPSDYVDSESRSHLGNSNAIKPRCMKFVGILSVTRVSLFLSVSTWAR